MDLHGLHVLLAEDNDLNAEIAVALLGEQGMLVTRTADGKSALAQFCNTDPGTFDLILMDIMMPEMNGYETTKAIRNLPDRPDGKENTYYCHDSKCLCRGCTGCFGCRDG
ncbi:MAG: response regulator [Blautia sp.]